MSELSRKKAEAEGAAEEAEQRLAQAHEAALEELRRELDDQRAKNNDLRTKNWEAVEAMRAAERKAEAQAAELTKELETLKASHAKEVQGLQQRLLKEQEQKERELLQRLLPKVKVVDGGLAHTEWLVHFERELRQWEEKSRAAATPVASVVTRGTGDHLTTSSAATQSSHAAPTEEDARRIQQLAQANSKLDKEVSHYKRVLSETEEMLQTLQRSVEHEEKGWRQREEEHQRERLQWQQQLQQAESAQKGKEQGPTDRERQLEQRCAALEADLRQLQGLQETTSEMQAKLKELQAKLQDEEGEKKLLEQKYDEVSRNAQDVRTHLESRVQELEEIKLSRDDYDLLKKELSEVKAQLAEAQRAAAAAAAAAREANHSPPHSPPPSQPPAKVASPTSSPATNGPSATPPTDDKLEDSSEPQLPLAGDDPSAGSKHASSNSGRSKKRVRTKKGSSTRK